MGAKSKKERSGSASTANYGGSISDAATSRAGTGSNGKDDRLEQLQADHELFLQAFESKENIKYRNFCRKIQQRRFSVSKSQNYNHVR